MSSKKKILLSIAGFDPSGGAGALLDVRVFEILGFQGMAVLTALTVQDTQKVRKVLPYSPQTVKAQYEVLSRDVSFSGIKSGMLGSKANAAVLGHILIRHLDIPRVIDPVLRSTSGARLMEKAGLPSFLKAVHGCASLLTPNLMEAALLAGIPVDSPKSMREAARIIFDLTAIPCLVKGGHLKKNAVNVLYDGQRTALFGHEKLRTDVHGTGCFLSSSILGFLAQGHPLDRACGLATDFTHKAIQAAIRPGKGRYLFIFPGNSAGARSSTGKSLIRRRT